MRPLSTFVCAQLDSKQFKTQILAFERFTAGEYFSSHLDIRYLRASHDGAPDALPVPGLPVCSKHLLRGVDILVAGGAGVAGAPLSLGARVSHHSDVMCVLSVFGPRLVTARGKALCLYSFGLETRIELRK